MNPVDNRYSKYQIAIIETCGEALASEQDWNDTDSLEEVWFSKHPEGFPMQSLLQLVMMNHAPRDAVMNMTTIGESLKVLIEARLSRFIWRPEDFRMMSDEESRETNHSDWPDPGEKEPLHLPGCESAS